VLVEQRSSDFSCYALEGPDLALIPEVAQQHLSR
jgi:hypothetical protein